MKILGIETSCDDTAIAVVHAEGKSDHPVFKVLSNVISSQVETHAEFGGVVPTLAAREHAKNFTPVLQQALTEAGTKPEEIDLVAVTTHPGLMPALLVGVHAARAFAWRFDTPIVGVNHLEGHLAANLLDPSVTVIAFPAVALIVSGGHTQLVLMRSWTDYKILGQTRDDAAGEAFDKVAKLIGLPFPGGPPIAAYAAKAPVGSNWTGTNGKAFPRPMMKDDTFDFSFSGLKTAVLYAVRDRYGTVKSPDIPDDEKATLCAEFQQAVVDVLVKKTARAASEYHAETVMLGGGVAANAELRKQLGEALPDSTAYLLPPKGLSVDNGAMIAAAAYLRWEEKPQAARDEANWRNVTVQV